MSSEEQPAKKSIGYYDLDKNIGEGNFAKVRLGTHTLTGEKVNDHSTRLPSKSLIKKSWIRQRARSFLGKSES